MSEIHSSSSRFYMAGIDMSALFKDMEGGSEQTLVDSTMFAATADSHVVSPVVKRTLTAGGRLDVNATTGAHVEWQAIEAAAASLGGANVCVWQMRDTTVGDPGLVIVGSLPKPTLKSPLKDIVQTAFTAQSNVSGWCNALKPKTAMTSAGSATGFGVSALTTHGGISVLQVMALTGTTPVLTVKTQHSSDSTNGIDGTWVDLATHAVVNTAGVTAGYADVQQVAGTVNKWLRHTFAVTSGSLTSVTLAHQFVRIP